MLPQTQYASDNDQSERTIHEILPINKGKSLYWRVLPTLAVRLHGELVLPGDPDFASLRAAWNETCDGYPAVIVRCVDAEDVIAAVTFAHEQGLKVSVRSGGYNIAGCNPNYNGIVIDLSLLKAITIDPQQHIVRSE